VIRKFIEKVEEVGRQGTWATQGREDLRTPEDLHNHL
jgi:predicted aspartyl protease